MVPTAEDVVLNAIRCVERRDVAELARLYHADIEFWWPPGLPYSGRHAGTEVDAMGRIFAGLWAPLQPTEAERAMDPVVVAVDGERVVVEYQWRARAANGAPFETSVLAAYRVRCGQLDRARMYYEDHAGLCRFLAQAGVPADGEPASAT